MRDDDYVTIRQGLFQTRRRRRFVIAGGVRLGPGSPTIVDLTDASDTGFSTADNITSDTTPDFIIDFATPLVENDIVEIKSDSTTIVSHIVSSGEADLLTLTLGVTLSAGTQVIAARHGRAGNFSPWSTGLTITVDTVAPTISTASTANCAENAQLAITLAADETVTWSITGGADQAKFEISGTTLRWAGNGTKDFEAPDDADTNNTYVAQVTATDAAGNATNKTITVTVTDVAEGIEFAWVSQASQTADSATFNTGSLNIGTADANRRILIGIAGRPSTPATVTAVTLNSGAITATQMAGAAASIANFACVDWWYANVPSGTTATIEMTFGSSFTRAKVEIYRIVSTNAAPSSAATPQTSSSGNSLNHAITVPAGGASASMYWSRIPGNGNDITWTNAIKDDTTIQLEAFSTVGSAKATASATITASITGAAAEGVGLSTVAWG